MLQQCLCHPVAFVSRDFIRITKSVMKVQNQNEPHPKTAALKIQSFRLCPWIEILRSVSQFLMHSRSIYYSVLISQNQNMDP